MSASVDKRKYIGETMVPWTDFTKMFTIVLTLKHNKATCNRSTEIGASWPIKKIALTMHVKKLKMIKIDSTWSH